MEMPSNRSRRVFLGSLAIGVLAVAGCSDTTTEPDKTSPAAAAPTTTETDTAADSTTMAPDEDTTASDDEQPTDETDQTEAVTAATTDGGSPLDLREANVVGVTIEQLDGGFSFDVSLHHDDSGEDGYANWWQVERLDGTRLGRRDLLHPHSQQPFTRSETIDVPDDVTCVVVRGHDQTHRYGGQAIVVNLETGATAPVDQGSDRKEIDASACP